MKKRMSLETGGYENYSLFGNSKGLKSGIPRQIKSKKGGIGLDSLPI